MPNTSLLASVVVLVAWSQLMQVWMFAARFPALKRAGIGLRGRRGGPTRNSIESVVPAEVSWKAHNYAHLMEQPTIFYAIVLSLVLLKRHPPATEWLAWGYVGSRIVHSLIQATVNIVVYRLAAFVLGSVCLALLTIEAAAALAL